MLVLSRKIGEKVVIGDNIEVTVQRVSGGRVSLAITAPRDVRILRGELDPFEGKPVPKTSGCVPAPTGVPSAHFSTAHIPLAPR